MMKTQVQIIALWYQAGCALRALASDRLDEDDGEVTAQTALIVLLVAAAIVAGGIIATRMTDNANNIESP